jgi:hypothetical protein
VGNVGDYDIVVLGCVGCRLAVVHPDAPNVYTGIQCIPILTCQQNTCTYYTACICTLKVFLTDEKRGELTVVLFDRGLFQLFTLKFSYKPVRSSSCKRPKTAQRTLFLLFANKNCLRANTAWKMGSPPICLKISA